MPRFLPMIVVVALMLMPDPLTAEVPFGTGSGHERQLKTTLIGKLEPGAIPRLAVRWNGLGTQWLDVWVDFDGDGSVGAGELVISGRELAPGIEVITLEIEPELFDVSRPDLSVRTLNSDSHAWNEVGLTGFDSKTDAECGWQLVFYAADLDDDGLACAVFDDGTGPALYVAGDFVSVGGLVVNHIARWDGESWSALGGASEPGTDRSVLALAVYDGGGGPALFVGGYLSVAGGITVNRIARWDGVAWSAVGAPSDPGMDGGVRTLVTYDDGNGMALFAGGEFSVAGGVTVNHIARWNGTIWSALSGSGGNGANDTVNSLATYDDGNTTALFAGGEFSTAGGVTVNHIARWNGTTWSALSGSGGTGTDGSVDALATFDDGAGTALFVGGGFTMAGGVTTNHIARWDSTEWLPLLGSSGTGVDGSVEALAVFDDGGGSALFVGGRFASAAGVAVDNIALWDGQAWSALSGVSAFGLGGVPYSSSAALAVFDDGNGPVLFVGGGFSRAGDVPVSNIARWDGSTWDALSGSRDTTAETIVLALEVFDDGGGPALYAGGLDVAGGLTVNGVAKWDGTNWSGLWGPSGMGLGELPGVRALAVFDDGGGEALYVGGFFSTAGGVSANNIAKWNGSQWSGLTGGSGNGVGGRVDALRVFDDGGGPALFIGGEFTTAGGVAAANIAKWDGLAWSALGQGVSDVVGAIGVYDEGGGQDLFVGGRFSTAGGVGAIGIARWDGSVWSAMLDSSGFGLDPVAEVHALEVFDDGSGPALFVAGAFSSAGGNAAHSIARWNGTQWSVLSGSSGTGTDAFVFSLVAYDDGSGSSLYVGGWYSTAGGILSHSISRWDGSEWSQLSGPSGPGFDGNDPIVYALEVFDDGGGEALFAGGDFYSAGGVASKNIAKWMCTYRVFADGFETVDTSMWSVTQP